MKVLIISLAYVPFIGGAELAIKEITDRIDDVSFDLITVNLDGKQAPIERVGRVTVHRIGKGRVSKYTFPLAAYRLARSLHEREQYNVVWSMMANQAAIAAYFFKKRFPAVRYVLSLQEGDSLKRIWSRTLLIRPLYKKIYRTADAIQVISEFLAVRARRYGFEGRLEIVPNGVDATVFKKVFSSEERAALRAKLGLVEDDRVVFTASRLVHKNAVDAIIKAAKNVEAKFLIAGTGPLEIKLRSLAQEIGVRDKILFLGHISHRDLPPYLAIADVFTRPSRSEGLGSAFLESMAAGVPIIATKVGGIPDFLRDGENGLYCEVDNPADLARKINQLLSDEPLRQKLSENGKALIGEAYDWNHIASRVKTLFI